MKQLSGYNLGILGGDQRERVMMECLIEQGAKLTVLGDPGNQLSSKVTIVFSVDELVQDVQAIVAPMSGTDAEGMIKARFVQEPVYLDDHFFDIIPVNVPLLIGNVNSKIKDRAEQAGVQLQLIAKREDVGVLNAIPTAEGALQIAMEELPITIHGCKSLVIGLGKCGYTLAWRLRALGSDVWGVTRSSEAIAKAQDIGIHTITYTDLEDYLADFDLIYNTVPAMVLDMRRLQKIRQEAVIIDLASAPGGTDFETAKQLGIKALLSLGLPGKVAPITAGKILGHIIPQIIIEQVTRPSI